MSQVTINLPPSIAPGKAQELINLAHGLNQARKGGAAKAQVSLTLGLVALTQEEAGFMPDGFNIHDIRQDFNQVLAMLECVA